MWSWRSRSRWDPSFRAGGRFTGRPSPGAHGPKVADRWADGSSDPRRSTHAPGACSICKDSRRTRETPRPRYAGSKATPGTTTARTVEPPGGPSLAITDFAFDAAARCAAGVRSGRCPRTVIVAPSSALEALLQIRRPRCPDALGERLDRTGDDREGLLAPERDAGVDDHARIAPVGLGVVAHRVERRAPSAVDDIDLIARIAARAHGPDHVAEVGRVDVVVHDD